ncbi:MAG: CPBP family intramembrane metalloprotease [Cyclobacteriaceae bacterium]|nr:CPBP family intramembrane metalloprotease [Cyclobacteriaceae bacterium]
MKIFGKQVFVANLKSTFKKVLAGWILVFTGLGLAGLVGDYAVKNWSFEPTNRLYLQALVMSGIVLPGILFLRKRLDKGTPDTIGFQGLKSNLKSFGLGMGIIMGPLLVMALFSDLLGWSDVQINYDSDTTSKLVLGLLTVLFFEALPEELLFRGYLYSNLRTSFKKWQAGTITVLLFLLLPITLSLVQKYFFGMEISLSGANTITMEYVIMILVFGSFIQYLRIMTNNVFTGMGFHLFFIGFNRINGNGATSLKFIQFNDITNNGAMQITMLVCVVIIVIGLLVFPYLSLRNAKAEALEA